MNLSPSDPRQDPAPPACADDCPVRRCAQLIEGKWTTQIVRDLLPGTRRYSELLAGLPGISPKVLAERLRLLERHGVLVRTVFAEVPPRTEYTLTPLGQQLRGVIAAMAAFGAQLTGLTGPQATAGEAD
ncbi:winged helix-turn-helix transcriptional regulator [Ideonella livida]|uniref:Helix-turn-helix transcriptional regulator n=1 Tax=Ideonella livida TaxID=2707176 RepID=A0A7C9TKG1_9BURK|nr:helix-turn-helix domain-containing protein [Ideonella livida]NDY92720.1 helix-turn-helix transcriptional regulator [Ideonella livida]